MSNTNQTFAAIREADEEFGLDPAIEEQDSGKRVWIQSFAAKYGEQNIKRMHGGFVEFFVDLPTEFIDNKLLQKWGIGMGSKLIIRFTPTPKVLHLSKNETLGKFSVRTQVESMLESIINKLTNNVRDAEKEPDPKTLKELIEMGFNREFAGFALIEVENDIERAIEVFDVVASKVKAMNNAKQNYVKHGLYVAIREYIIERLPYMTSFCAICDGVHIDNPNTEQSSVCSRQLCTFRFESMQLLAPDYYYVPTRVNNAPKKDIVSIAAGSNHSVFCTFDGAVYSWGEGTQGQLGDGYDEDKSAPACIDALVKFVTVAAGDRHTVGLSEQKELYVWGSGNEALGFGNTVKYKTPQKLFVSERIRHISVIGNQNFALSEEGAIWVWGNILGQVYSTPTKLNVSTRFITVRASLRAPTAVDQHGSIWLWTEYAKGFERIAQRTENEAKYQREVPPPDPIIIMKDAVMYGPTLIAVTNYNKMLFFNLADIVRRRSTGELCLIVEKRSEFGLAVHSLVIGHNYAAVIDVSRSVHVRGHGKAVLGFGEKTTSVQDWSKVPLPTKASQLVAGPSHVLCLTTNQDLYVWGRNHGAAGFAINSSINDRDNDVKVPANFVSPIVFKEVEFFASNPSPIAPSNSPSIGPIVFKPNIVNNLQRPNPGPLKLKVPQGEVPPPRYPSLNRDLPVAPQLGARQRYLATKDKDITNRLRHSPYHYEPPKVKREVEKFSDQTVQQNNFKPKVTNLLKEHSEYFPSELMSSSRKKVDGGTLLAHTLRNLNDYEKKEAAYKENKKNNKKEDKEEKEEDDEVMAEEEDEDNDDEFHDYHVNQFDDDDDGMGSESDGNNEPYM